MHAPQRSDTSTRRTRLAWTTALWVLLAGLGPACGEEELPATASRGAPKLKNKKNKTKAAGKAAAGSRRRGRGGAAQPAELVEDSAPKRPPPKLDETTFKRMRDPFRSFVAAEAVEPEPDRPRAERQVQMGQYSFEDLKLIGIVHGGRNIRSRATFVASDGRSHSVLQGEYFSSAEVLLAAVNRDYVEIEVVDEERAESLGLSRGERQAIYLRNE